jgi:hypothetical protein
MRVLTHSIAVVALVAGAACDTTPRGRDAAAGAQRISEAAVRFEVVGDGALSVSMLAYRASASGLSTDDVLSIVDPLTAPAPEGACVVRDVAEAARALVALGNNGANNGAGKVELEALSGLNLDLGMGTGSLVISPSPRVFPDLASVVGGVVSEAGPVTLEGAPGSLALVDSAGNRAALALPAQPRLTGPEGGSLPANSTLDVAGDLILGVSVLGGAGTPGAAPAHPAFLELRPFGATWALACPVGNRDRVVIPAAEVTRLANLHVPVSIEAVTRETHPVTVGGTSVRLTLEVRSSSVGIERSRR